MSAALSIGLSYRNGVVVAGGVMDGDYVGDETRAPLDWQRHERKVEARTKESGSINE